MRRLFKGGYYINLPVLQRRLLFKGGIYLRAALIQGNTVYIYIYIYIYTKYRTRVCVRGCDIARACDHIRGHKTRVLYFV